MELRGGIVVDHITDDEQTFQGQTLCAACAWSLAKVFTQY